MKIAPQTYYRWLACPVRPTELEEAYLVNAEAAPARSPARAAGPSGPGPGRPCRTHHGCAAPALQVHVHVLGPHAEQVGFDLYSSSVSLTRSPRLHADPGDVQERCGQHAAHLVEQVVKCLGRPVSGSQRVGVFPLRRVGDAIRCPARVLLVDPFLLPRSKDLSSPSPAWRTAQRQPVSGTAASGSRARKCEALLEVETDRVGVVVAVTDGQVLAHDEPEVTATPAQHDATVQAGNADDRAVEYTLEVLDEQGVSCSVPRRWG